MRMKYCTSCQEEKPKSAFSKNKAKKDGLQTTCKACKKEQQKFWYDTNKKAHKANVKKRNEFIIKENQAKIMKILLKSKCIDCGLQDPLVLEFDHRNRNDKSNNISTLAGSAYSWSKIEKEIAKCDVRCANCHRRKTHIENKCYRIVYIQE